LPNCYRLTIRHGYNDVPVTENLGTIVYEELRKYIIASHAQHAQPSEPSTVGSDTSAVASRSSALHEEEQNPESTFAYRTSATPYSSSLTASARLTRRLNALDTAYSTQVVYIVGKEQLRLIRSQNNIAKRFVLGIFLWLRENTRAKVASMRIPVEKLVEVGFVREI